MGRTYMIFGFRSLRKPSKIKGSGVRRVHKGHTISSQPRYDRFDTSPYSIGCAYRHSANYYTTAALKLQHFFTLPIPFALGNIF